MFDDLLLEIRFFLRPVRLQVRDLPGRPAIS